MSAFAFSRPFLSRVRTEGVVFHSLFPSYYLANIAMGMGSTITISPEPLAIAGVSRPSVGGTSFNLEEMGTALLNANLREMIVFTVHANRCCCLGQRTTPTTLSQWNMWCGNFGAEHRRR